MRAAFARAATESSVSFTAHKAKGGSP
jgi:hypothetical protein